MKKKKKVRHLLRKSTQIEIEKKNSFKNNIIKKSKIKKKF